MGRIKDAWRLLTNTPPRESSVPPPGGTSRDQIAKVSPWQEGSLSPIGREIYDRIFGLSKTLTRQQAMSIPAVAKGRQILVSQIAKSPLRAYRGEELVTPQPTFLHRTDTIVSPWHRLCWTVDDHIFYGWSLWGVRRGAAGQVLAAERCPINRWRIQDGLILVDDQPVDSDTVLLIPGPGEGLLDIASRTLRGAVELEESTLKRAKNPIPMIVLQDTEGQIDDDDEIDELRMGFMDARDDDAGGVAYSPQRIKPEALGTLSPDLFTAGRNFYKIDIANFFGLPAALFDASPSTASLTYSTREGARNELDDLSLDYWRDPIAGRLSQDDVVPAGQRIRFDLADELTTTPSPIGPTTED